MPEPISLTPHLEDDAAVAKIFSELKPRERALLWLAYVEGESHEEIASALGLRRRGVRVMLFRAKRRARSPLDVVQPIEIAGGLVAAGLLLYWSLPYLL